MEQMYDKDLGPLRMHLVNGLVVTHQEGVPVELNASRIRKGKQHFWVSETEYLGSKNLHTDYAVSLGPYKRRLFDNLAHFFFADDEWPVVVASLIWIVAILQQDLGFVHRELKPDNIVWRTFGK
jgi:hypothetical protein